MKPSKKYILLLSQLIYALTAYGDVIYVTNNDGGFASGSLNDALQNIGPDTIIDCSPIAGQTINLSRALPAIGHNTVTFTPTLTILGNGVTIDGGSVYPGFSLAQGTATITGFTIQNGLSKGGAGGLGFTGGGGGTGGGGALYVHSGTTLTISTLALNNNQAIGGNGGAGNATGGSGGGGGGFGGGAGGRALLSGASAGSGGGGGGNNGGTGGGRDGGVGIPNSFTNYGGAGGGGEIPGTTGAKSGGTNASVPAKSGGVGGLGTSSNGAGGGGGGGSATIVSPTPPNGGNGFNGANSIDYSTPGTGVGGAGGFGFGSLYTYGCGGGGGGGNGGGDGYGTSGGGGGVTGPGGSGGAFGGGGGASSSSIGATHIGGNGGFGAGGGAGHVGGVDSYGLGGSGGSAVNLPAGGGGGSGLGGAIFIQQGASLIIEDGISFSGNSTTAGNGGVATGGSNGGNGTALGEDIFIQGGGNLTLQIDGTLTIPNPIMGAGTASSPGLVKAGTGIVNLSGGNTYLGNTYVQSGMLNLNGSIAGDIHIDAAGSLSGNATISGNIYNSGTISPGNSIGTIFTTNLQLTSSSIYEVEVSSTGASDEIIASGTAQVGGTVFVIPDSTDFASPATYTIISSGSGVSGTFSSLSSTVPAIMSLIYTPFGVELSYLPLDSITLKGNALKAANCFTTVPMSAVNTALLGLSFEELQTAFNQMGPAQFSDITQVQLIDAILVRSSYTRHLKDLPNCNGITFWSDILGQWQQQKKSNHLFGYRDATVGATIGGDFRCRHFLWGTAVSYTNDKFNWSQDAGYATINSYYGGFYGLWDCNGFYINSALLGGQNKYKTARHLHFGTIDRLAQAKHNGHQWLVNIGGGYEMSMCNLQWTPYINLDYVFLREHGFSERGAETLDLHVASKNARLFQGEAGVQFTTHYCACNGVIVPTLDLAYVNQTPLCGKSYHANFVSSCCEFSGNGGSFERNLFSPALTLTYQSLCGMVDASIYYSAEIGNHYWVQDVGCTVDFRF